MEKSAIIFSSSVDRHIMQGLLSILGFKKAQSYDKYLGLTMVIGKNKRRTFDEIKDKSVKKGEGLEAYFFFFFGRRERSAY